MQNVFQKALQESLLRYSIIIQNIQHVCLIVLFISQGKQ